MFIAPPIKTPAGDQPMPVFFGSGEDACELESWTGIHGATANARDAIEYAPLAGKRWRYYAGRNEAARTLEDLINRSKGTEDEIGFLLAGRANWQSAPSKTLVFAWCRRTYCNHLILDFLAAHPAAQESSYGRLGLAMLLSLSFIARRIHCPLIWGEATKGSAKLYEAYYRKYGGTVEMVTDHFFFRDNLLENLCEEGEKYQVLSSHE